MRTENSIHIRTHDGPPESVLVYHHADQPINVRIQVVVRPAEGPSVNLFGRSHTDILATVDAIRDAVLEDLRGTRLSEVEAS